MVLSSGHVLNRHERTLGGSPRSRQCLIQGEPKEAVLIIRSMNANTGPTSFVCEPHAHKRPSSGTSLAAIPLANIIRFEDGFFVVSARQSWFSAGDLVSTKQRFGVRSMGRWLRDIW